MREHIRTWTQGEFRLELFDTNSTRYGKCRLAYEFFHKEELIFKGDDFCCSPMHSIDGDASVGALLSFLSLKPGDTDMEYFRDYTAQQFAFCKEFGEELSLLAMELEECPKSPGGSRTRR